MKVILADSVKKSCPFQWPSKLKAKLYLAGSELAKLDEDNGVIFLAEADKLRVDPSVVDFFESEKVGGCRIVEVPDGVEFSVEMVPVEGDTNYLCDEVAVEKHRTWR